MRSRKALRSPCARWCSALALASGPLRGAGPRRPGASSRWRCRPTSNREMKAARTATRLFITNSGGKATDRSPITITDTLPAGLEVKSASSSRRGGQPTATGLQNDGDSRRSEHGQLRSDRRDSRPEADPSQVRRRATRCCPEVVVKVPPIGRRSARQPGRGRRRRRRAGRRRSREPGRAEDAPAGLRGIPRRADRRRRQAGDAADSHPYQYTTSFAVNMVTAPPGVDGPFVPAEGDLKDIEVALPPGLVGNPTAVALHARSSSTPITVTISALGGHRNRQRMPGQLGGGDGDRPSSWKAARLRVGRRSTTSCRRKACRPSSASRSWAPRSTSTRAAHRRRLRDHRLPARTRRRPSG